MDTSSDLQERIAEAVARFEKRYMALQPESVLVDVHESDILVTLRQVVSAAEREGAQNDTTRDRLEKLSTAVFNAVKGELETEVAQLTGRQIKRSRINVDPLTGDAIVHFILEESNSPTNPACDARRTRS